MTKKILHYGGNIAEGLLAVVLYGVLQIFYFTPQIVHKRWISNMNVQIVVTAIITVVIMWFIFWMYKKQLQSTNEWGFNKEPHWSRQRVWTALAMIVVIFFASGILMLILGRGEQTSSNQTALKVLADNGNLFMFKIMVILIAPFCEELIFRGMFFNTFFIRPTNLNKWLGIFTSGLLFAYIHDPKFSKFILVYWLMGIILAWTYLKTKDIRYSMIAHIGNNLIASISIVCLL